MKGLYVHLSLLFLALFSGGASAYPNFMGFGYQACLSCHYNPMGGGPLTDYGRVVSATLIADRVLWDKNKSDEQLERESGFAFRPPFNDWARPQLNYRGLYLKQDAGRAAEKSRFITMEASAALVAKLNKDRLIFVADLSYAPKPMGGSGGGDQSFKDYCQREFFAGYRLTKEWGVYAGLMDKAFGIRVPDHAAYSRSVTGLNQNDQTYGVLGHYLKNKWEIALQPFVGNFVQAERLRQKGFTTQLGYNLSETARIGYSFLRSKSSYSDLLMYSIEGRLSVSKGDSLLAEFGQVDKSADGVPAIVSRYLFVQNHFLLRQGLFSVLTLEMLQRDINDSSQTYRFGPGVQYYMSNHVEWRADIYDSRSFQSSSDSPDSWTLTAQMHLWF